MFCHVCNRSLDILFLFMLKWQKNKSFFDFVSLTYAPSLVLECVLEVSYWNAVASLNFAKFGCINLGTANVYFKSVQYT